MLFLPGIPGPIGHQGPEGPKGQKGSMGKQFCHCYESFTTDSHMAWEYRHWIDVIIDFPRGGGLYKAFVSCR